MDTISEEEYERLFAKYLKEQGPNKGTGFFGSWAWQAKQKREFNEKLKEEGIILSSS